MVCKDIAALANYAVRNGLIEECDRIWAINRLLEALNLREFEACEVGCEEPLENILGRILDDAVERGVIEEGVVSRVLLDTKLMGILTPRPSVVIREFSEKYQKSPVEATD